MRVELTCSSLREKRICLCTTPAYLSAQRGSNPRHLDPKSSAWPLGYMLKLVGPTDLNRPDIPKDTRAKTPRPI